MGIDYYLYTTKDIKRLKFFRTGFYISLIIWACGMAFSIIGGELFDIPPVIRLVLIFVPLGIYIFFVIGKAIIEANFGRKSNGNM